MKQFHTLKIAAKHQETRDSVRVALTVPDELKPSFAFLPGQHVPVQIETDGKKLRRTYSICSAAGQWPIEIGVRVQPGGQFSQYAADELQVGDSILVMPPNGSFHLELIEREPIQQEPIQLDADSEQAKRYLGFAAGSGITPILSIIKTVLRKEPTSQFSLFYGNRKQSSTMFIEDLYALKNCFPERLQLHFVFSQEDQEFDIASGRLDGAKTRQLYQRFCHGPQPTAAFVCGPDSMISDVHAALVELGMAPETVRSERFGTPRQSLGVPRSPPKASPRSGDCGITVIMDGHRKSFDMHPTDGNIVDAAGAQGIELPYSCKGGVCATCRTHVREGEVRMATNYGLEPWEVEAGFVLACQSTPVSDSVILDYDKT